MLWLPIFFAKRKPDRKQDDVYVLSFANLSFSVSAGRVVGLFLLNVKIGSC